MDFRVQLPDDGTEDPSSYGGSSVSDWVRKMYEFLRSSQGLTPQPDYSSTKTGPDLTPPPTPMPSPSPSRPLPPYPPSMAPFSAPPILPSHRVPSVVPPQPTSIPRPAPVPSSGLNFAWGGGTPQPYNPGSTDITRAEGAPVSDSFLGRVTRPGGGGTFTQLNPPAYKDEDTLAEEAFRNRIERSLKDPMWEEKEKARIWSEAQIGAQSGLFELRAKQIQRWANDQKNGIDNDPNTTPEAKKKAKDQIDYQANDALQTLYGGSGSQNGVRSPGNFPKI